MGAVVLPAWKIASMIALPRIPLMMPINSAPMAPNPAASVGVNTPVQIPPMTSRINPRIPNPPTISERRSAGVSSTSGDSNAGAISGLRMAAMIT